MIDLHLHTTASDGRLSPPALVARAADAGLSIIAITDHDTLEGVAAAHAAVAERDLRLIVGVELTAVEDGRDLHVLGYFLDPDDPGLAATLVAQRERRVTRLREIAARLAALGAPVDVDALLASASDDSGRALGRPHLARALVEAGHATSVADAFARFLGTGAPAFVPRRGLGAMAVIEVIHAAGGVASMAHPAISRRDDLIPALVDHGLDALEALHTDHDEAARARYLEMAATYGLAVSGGSDFHGAGPADGGARRSRDRLGETTLPREHFETLEARAAGRR